MRTKLSWSSKLALKDSLHVRRVAAAGASESTVPCKQELSLTVHTWSHSNVCCALSRKLWLCDCFIKFLPYRHSNMSGILPYQGKIKDLIFVTIINFIRQKLLKTVTKSVFWRAHNTRANETTCVQWEKAFVYEARYSRPLLLPPLGGHANYP